MLNKEKPIKKPSGFTAGKSELTLKREAAMNAGGTQNTRIEAKLDYVIALLERKG